MLDDSLKYNFPKSNSAPFDHLFEGNYFVFANAYSNLSENLKDFSFSIFEQNIPMGYKTITICQRILHIQNGKILKEWPIQDGNDGDSKINSVKYFLTSNKLHPQHIIDWNRNIESAAIKRPELSDGSLNSFIWYNIEQCKEYAEKLSNETKSEILISVIIDTINWH